MGVKIPPGDATGLRLNAGTGSILPSFYAVSNPLVGNPALNSEQAQTVDAAVSQTGPRGRLVVEAGGFPSRYRDGVDFNPGSPLGLVNRSRIRNDGFESSLRARSTISPNLMAAWSCNNVRSEPPGAGGAEDRDGERSLRSWTDDYAEDAEFRVMLALLEVIQRTTDFFSVRGVESPRLNAELLVGHVLGLPRMQLYLQFERLLTEQELERLRPLVRRRSGHEPLQYILGETEFFHVRLKIDRRALIPRPETEFLCELVTRRLAGPPRALLDLGTGSGAIALGLATYYPEAAVTAVDASAEALGLARENAERLGLAGRVRLLQSDWFTAIVPPEQFDLIVGNPPYLSATETAAAMPEVREHEPAVALTAGPGGPEALVRIIAAARPFLRDGGLLALETGADQHSLLRERAAAAGFARVESQRDLAERDRYLLAWRS